MISVATVVVTVATVVVVAISVTVVVVSRPRSRFVTIIFSTYHRGTVDFFISTSFHISRGAHFHVLVTLTFTRNVV